MKSIAPIHAPRVAEQDVLSKTDYFVDVQLWPLMKTLDARRWLDNFSEAEKDYAIHLLNGFMYFSPALMDELFISAIQSLSSSFYQEGGSFLTFQSSWRQFIDSVIVTYVTGETPNPSDSGFAFARRARQLVGISEDRIVTPDDAVRLLLGQATPIIFVDDFVGSGEQFVKTWQRSVSVAGTTSSFERIAQIRGADFYYCPLLCTGYGHDRINRECPTVIVNPAHLLSDRYSALNPDSIIWPEHLRSTATDFLRSASLRAGIQDTNGGSNDWRGFHKLGLSVALGNSVPDASLPIFYWEKNGYRLDCSRAMAFLLNSIRFLRPQGEIVSIIPAGSPSSQKDEKAWALLHLLFREETVGVNGHKVFTGCFPRTRIIHLTPRKAMRVRPIRNESAGTGNALTSTVCFYRGKIPMYRVPDQKPQFAIPLVHSTSLRSSKVVLGEFFASATSTTSVGGPILLLPRVGQPKRSKLVLYRARQKVALSDCVFGLKSEKSTLLKLHDSMQKNWLKIENLYTGTGAKYIASAQVAGFVRSLGFTVQPANGYPRSHSLARAINRTSETMFSRDELLVIKRESQRLAKGALKNGSQSQSA
jgi:hypothetical protein